ncbi:MAG: flagellar basal body P-ring formation protein FlgA [Deltaproteobacteria bacterium]|nr:flagellar basal body P-ring formation protein FlgA [Deltaproteobacteria bacterium]
MQQRWISWGRWWIMQKCMVLILTWSATAVAQTQAWTVTLLPHVDAPPAHLSDILDRYQTSPELLERFGLITLGLAVGQAEINPVHVLALLTRAGVDAGQLIIQGRGVTIGNGSRPDEMQTRLAGAVQQKLAELKSCDPADFHVTLPTLPSTLPQATSFTKLQVEIEPQHVELETIPARVKFLNEQGELVSQVDLEAKVAAQQTVVIAARALVPGVVVTKDDFLIERRVVAAAPGELVVRDLAAITEGSWQVARALAPGEVVTQAVLRPNVTLQKGTLVTITARDTHFQVHAQGRVKALLENGNAVLVENTDSKKEIVARPISNSEVEIVF